MRFFVFFLLVALVKAEDCVWNRETEFSKYPALLMDMEVKKSILPVLDENEESVIKIGAGDEVLIGCPGNTILATDTEFTVGTCECGNTVNVGGSSYSMKDLGCKKRVKESVRSNLGTCGDGVDGMEHAIGYELPNEDFYELIRICFDPLLENTLYTHHILRGESADARDKNPSRPGFRKGSGFFTVDPDDCYKISSQDALLTDMLGDEDIILDSNYYFARGHLSPDADFMTEMESDATYYFINVVPQWQIFNNGNWKYTEMAVRDLSIKYRTDMEIWTGSWDILELDDTNNNPVKIFLGLAEGKEVIPAPDVTWKVILEPSTQRAVAIVGVNNPYVESMPPTLCEDICDQIKWMDFDTDVLTKGATYCCTVDDLRESIRFVPDLGSVGLLNE